jgi:hypothetical protein
LALMSEGTPEPDAGRRCFNVRFVPIAVVRTSVGVQSLLLGVCRTLFRFHQPLFILGREPPTIQRDRQLLDLTSEIERHLIVLIVRRARVGADVERLVPLGE